MAFLAYAALALLLYSPALHGPFISFDDMRYIVLNSDVTLAPHPGGFWLPGNFTDFWPVSYTLLWGWHRLFGDQALPYHLLNVALHALNAVLLTRLLRGIGVGAWIAGLLFLVHPVQVPAVAWIFQLKSLLALFFALLAAGDYLAHDADPSGARAKLGRAKVFFALAVLSKTSVVMGPVALAAFHFFRRPLPLRDFLRRTFTFWLLSFGSGLATIFSNKVMEATVEETLWGKTGFLTRSLSAGRNFWFYLAKLVWPAELSFLYPKVILSPDGGVANYLPFACLLGAAGMAVWLRRRHPAAGLAFTLYGANLFPALGWVSVPFMMMTLVADHWQYAATPAAFGLFGYGCAKLVARFPRVRWPGVVVLALLVATLGTKTWRRSALFRDEDLLWRDILTRTPESTFAEFRLGMTAYRRRDYPTARRHFERVLEIQPDDAYARRSLCLMDGGEDCFQNRKPDPR